MVGEFVADALWLDRKWARRHFEGEMRHGLIVLLCSLAVACEVSTPAAADSKSGRPADQEGPARSESFVPVSRVQLPASEDYVRRQPRLAWGAPCAVDALTRAMRAFRAHTEFDGDVVVSDMSRREGPTPPHRSHVDGLDVDIRLPTTEDHDWRERPPMFAEVDWLATWGLIEALASMAEVERIHLHTESQRRLHSAVADVSGARLEQLLQYPRGRLEGVGLVRHGEMMSHLHVHFACGEEPPA